MWQATKRIIRKPTIMPPLITNGKKYFTDEDKCNILADHYENTFTTPDSNVNPEEFAEVENSANSNKIGPEDTCIFTTPSEIKSIINKLPNKKAPGHDLIPNLILKNLSRKTIVFLCNIINTCFTTNYFPQSWKHADIIVFHKPGKDKNLPASYRPISLLTTLSKIFEKVVKNRLDEYISINNIIPVFQFGFKSKHSTNHQLLRLTEIIAKGFENKQHSIAAFIDVAQAFDRVWHKGLLTKLQPLVPEYLFNIIKSFISNRTFQVKINNSRSTTRNINAGVPQGSILGPILFNIYLHDIPTSPDISLAMYADDTAIITQNQDLKVARDNLQEALDTLTTWLNKWKIKLNPNKSESKIFSLRKVAEPENLKIYDVNIKWNDTKSTVKYLGVHFDRRLTWRQHVISKLKEANTRLAMLYPIINRKTTLKSECAKLIYQSILRPLLMYACPIWGATAKTHLDKLQSYQNKVLRIAVNAPWFIRNSQLHREMGMLTIRNYIKKTAKTFYNKINNCSGARHYNLGQTTSNRRLRSRLPQDYLLSSEDQLDE